MNRSWIIFLCCTFITITSNSVLAMPISASAKLIGNMVRIEFSMPKLANISLQQQQNSIIIDFGETITINPMILPKIATGYIENAELSKSLTAIIITTTKPYKINNLLLDNLFILELIGSPSTNLQALQHNTDQSNSAVNFPALISKNQQKEDLPKIREVFFPPQKPATSTNKQVLDIAVDSQPNKTLIEFNWNKKTPFITLKRNNGIYLIFRSNLKINDKDVINLLPKTLKAFKSENSNQKLNIFIPVPFNYNQKIIENNNSVVVSLTKKATIATKKTTNNIKAKPEVTKISKIKISPTEKSLSEITIVTNSNKNTLPPAPPLEEKQILEAQLDDAKALQQEKQEITSNIKSKDETIEKELIQNEDILNSEEQELAKEELIEENDEESNEEGRSFSLSFPWSRDTAAALFKKQGYWWLVFDRGADIDFSLLKRLGGDVVHEIVQLPNKDATIIRMIIDANYNPEVRKEGLLWIMDIVNKKTSPLIDLMIEPQLRAATGPRLFIPTTGVGIPQRIIDPLYGDAFTVVPVYGLGWGIATTREYPNLTIPKTVQGVVVEPLSPDVIVTASRSGVEISKIPNGLALSSDEIMSFEEDIDFSMEGLDKLFDLRAFERNNPEDFYKELPNFLARTAVSNKKQKNMQRLNLAKYYLSNGFAPEALAILRVIQQEDYQFAKSLPFLAVRGMANVLFNRPNVAIADLNQNIFEESDIAKVWLAAAYAQNNEFTQSQFNVFRKFPNVIRELPYDIKADIVILATKTALNQENDLMMDTYLEMLIPEKNNPYQQAAYDYYKGMYYEYLLDLNEASNFLEKAEESESQLYHVLASNELAEIDFKLDKISAETMAKKLEQNRYAWRGDNIEFNLLKRLVNIYIENEMYPEALRKIKEISEFFPNHKETKSLIKLGNQIFEDLYYNNKAENIDPIKAIALFNEFEHLIPENEIGKEMIKKLADRLVSVDLLENAATILQKQIDGNKLSGKQKSEIGTRLALIYLLENQPQNAIKALDNSIYFPITDSLEQHRTLIRAKALAESGFLNEAINILNIDVTDSTQKLKIDLYWAEQNWKKASEAIKPLIKKPQIGQAISEEQAKLLLAWATAMRLSYNEMGLQRLRENFIIYIKPTEYYKAFNIITSPSNEKIDIGNLNKNIQAVESFASFLSEYTKDIKDSNLSEVVK